jgi:outer membrane protein assembly factor BamA
LGYDYVELPKIVDNIPTASNTRIDRIIKSGINFIYDSRNLKQFGDSGLYANINYTHRGFGLNNINYSSLDTDIRYYLKVIDELTMKLRNKNRMTFGHLVPFYDHSFLGYGERIRGHYSDIREGHNLYLFSIDLKYPILKEWLFSIKLPLIPKELTTYRIGIYADIFGNTGATQFNNNTLSDSDFYSGYGAGFIFAVLPYNIASVSYALNEYNKGEIIFELGFTF